MEHRSWYGTCLDFHAVSTNPTLLLSLILINQFIIISKCQFTLTKSFCTFRWFSPPTTMCLGLKTLPLWRIQDPDHSLWNVFRIWMLYRRQWLTCAFQSVISTGINIHVQEPDWSFYTNWSSPSLQPARILGHHGGLWKQHHSEYPILKLLLRTCSFISPWPGYNANRGRVVVPPKRTWRPVLRAYWPKQGEPAKGARLRLRVEFNLSFLCNLKGRSSNNCFSCI